jgi:hypothetical protein
MTRGIAKTLQLARLPFVASICVRAGVQLDSRRADTRCRFELLRIRIDEQRDADARVGEPTAHRSEGCDLRRCVQPTLGGHFRAALRHEAAICRTHLAGDADHFVGRRHLEIQPRLQHLAGHANVAILDVPPIFAQMHRDVVRARLFGDQRGEDRVGIGRAARLAQRGDVIDVDSEVQHGGNATAFSARA